jgi:cell wall-associated NlpC family hydrolase
MTGGLLAYTGVKDVSMLEALRGLVNGVMPEGPGPKVTSVGFSGGASGGGAGGATAQPADYDPSGSGGSSSSSSGGSSSGGSSSSSSGGANPGIASAARKYLGVKYRWGGKNPATGLDCSGLVKVAIRDATGDTSCPAGSAGQAVWSKFTKIPRSEVGAGDVLWWPGHVVVADSNAMCISAPRPGLTVRVEAIAHAGPVGTGQPSRCLRYNGGTKAAAKAPSTSKARVIST